ncbi:unnamed protein product [Lactuca saligna]|uniref:Uncharacterized protein n=1 Tax=Lactuca saligna TaxID=75948 RepID=A0AA36EHJ9_LACSI|nr:unnamed protein product [Lactuca saligna]
MFLASFFFSFPNISRLPTSLSPKYFQSALQNFHSHFTHFWIPALSASPRSSCSFSFSSDHRVTSLDSTNEVNWRQLPFLSIASIAFGLSIASNLSFNRRRQLLVRRQLLQSCNRKGRRVFDSAEHVMVQNRCKQEGGQWWCLVVGAKMNGADSALLISQAPQQIYAVSLIGQGDTVHEAVIWRPKNCSS